MTNYEKYMEEIINDLRSHCISCEFVNKRVYREEGCRNRSCNECYKRVKEWLKQEYKSQIDWSKVPVDTPVIVYDKYNYHFESAEGDCVTMYLDGRTSWTSKGELYTIHKNRVKLALPEDIEKYSI